MKPRFSPQARPIVVNFAFSRSFAEADALALQRQQITPDLLALRKIENEREAIRKWGGKLPQVSGGATPFISVAGKR